MWAQVLRTNREQNFGQLEILSLVKSWKSVQMQQLGAKIVRTHGRYVSLDFSDSAALQKVKKSNMQRSAIKDVIYGGVMEIMRNRQYYYHSSVGSAYSHFTEEGREVLMEFLNTMGGKMMEAEHEELNERAKQQVIAELKKKD
jgi:hypothetical protein